MKRAVIYLRVSTAAQAEKDVDPEGYSIPAQRDACRRKAESLSADVVEEYIDKGESARSTDRPALQAMLSRIKEQRDVDYVIVHKVDRLARSRSDDVLIGLTLKAAEAQLVSVSENIDETPSGMLLHAIMSGVAEFYSRNLATEAIKGMTQKAKTGGTPNRAPIGYLNVRQFIDNKEIRTVEVDLERAPLVQWAYETYATGDYGLKELLREVTAKGLRTRATPSAPEKPLSLSRLAKMLQNRYYLGIITFRGVEYEGRHEPLIKKELFSRVQAVLKAHYLAGEKKREHPHYLKGTVFCGRCGARLCLTNAKGRYLYFFCLGRGRGEPCPTKYVLAEKVERAVADYYKTIQLELERVEKIRAGLLAFAAKLRLSSEREEKRQTARIIKLRDQRTKLLHAHYSGAVPLDLLKSEQERINREVAEAEAVLANVTVDLERVEENLDIALGYSGDCHRAYIESPDYVRRQFNQSFFERVLWDGVRIVGARLAQPFAELLSDDLVNMLEKELKNPGPVLVGRGSNKNHLVPPAGIEPALRPF